MNAKETIEAGKLMVEYGEEWERTGSPPKWVEYKARATPGKRFFPIKMSGWAWDMCEYRRGPEQKLVPFTADDITPGMQFRFRGIDRFTIAAGWDDETGVSLYRWGICVTPEELLEKYECRSVGETKWRPCGKVV